MIDAARLAALEAEFAVCRTSRSVVVGPATLGDLLDAAREAIRRGALIDAHNAGCREACERQAGHRCASLMPERCSTCPRQHMIDVPAGDAVAKEPTCR